MCFLQRALLQSPIDQDRLSAIPHRAGKFFLTCSPFFALLQFGGIPSIIIIIASTKKRASLFFGQFFASGQNLQKGDLIFMDIYLQGLTMGLAYVAPIGLQNLFVINTALTQRKSRVYATALIVIFFDVTLGLACFFGIGAIMSASPILEMVILGIGSLIVIWIGVGLVRAHDTMDTSTKVDIPILKVITTACVVTWFNPQALIDGSMMLGAFKATLPAGTDFFFVGGFASASILWFLSISTIISLFSAKFTDKTLRVINVVCGCVIIFYGLKLLWNFIQLVLPYLS